MEANLQNNFNVGFTNMRSDVLIHLTQWQYWWWFWFSLLWAFYYLMVLKMVRFRSLKFRPRIATTLRPHGKWGDLIVCIIPVSWCANIITNSNFILRMIEWQSESGLLTVRIRGKQWYWVYKFELKTFTDVFTVPKNIGHNKWQISTPNDLQVADDYLHILQLRSQNRWVKSYWDELTTEVSKSKDFHLISSQEQVKKNFYEFYEKNNPNLITKEEVVTQEGLKELYNRAVFFKTNALIVKDLDLVDKLTEDFWKDFLLRVRHCNLTISKVEFERLFLEYSGATSIDEFKDFLKANISYTHNGVEEVVDLKSLKENLFTLIFFDIIKSGEYAVKYFDDYSLFEDLTECLKNGVTETNSPRVDEFDIIWNFFTFEWFSLKMNSEQYTLRSWLNWLKAPLRADILFLGDDLFDMLNASDDFLLEGSLVDSNGTYLDKKVLPDTFYENMYIRLFNKKSNWNEVIFNERLDDSYKSFLTNEEVISDRETQVSAKNFFFDEFVSDDVEDVKTKFYNYSDFNEFDRLSRKSQGLNAPIRLIKYPISNKTNFDFNSDVVELFRFRYADSDLTTTHRPTPNSMFLIIRQKRYKRRKVILPRTVFYKEDDGKLSKRIKSSNYTFLSQNNIILENDFNATKRYKFFKKNKVRDELTNLVLSKRMLRTRRTLVLPAHLNITAITNSFDVIHSWFIPGLGLKMDAIPGRATHHTFYIDNVGFYYGQCAEICGRYHHHMPIRICALPFEHFLLWWQSFGLPKMLLTKNFRRYNYSYASRKYMW